MGLGDWLDSEPCEAHAFNLWISGTRGKSTVNYYFLGLVGISEFTGKIAKCT